jgi:predicted AAA+ superfamily ATPase
MVIVDASLALSGDQPHIIDEWQDVPKIWDAVRRKVDESGNQRGQFILTGSSSVDKSKVSHSGAGRIAKMHIGL